MRSFAVSGVLAVTMWAGCTGMTAQQNDVQEFCEITCACGWGVGGSFTNSLVCTEDCASVVGTSPISDACMACVYEYQHECSTSEQVCGVDCFASEQAPPLHEHFDGGGP